MLPITQGKAQNAQKTVLGSGVNRERLRDAIKLMERVSRLPLGEDNDLGKRIREVFTTGEEPK